MKAQLKRGLSWVAMVVISPLLIAHFAGRAFTTEGLFAAISQLLSLIPGKTGSYLRIGFYRVAMHRCAADCYIGFGSLFSQTDTDIGEGVYIGPQCNIGSCSIGDNTLVASGVHIMSGTQQHRFDDLNTPIRDQGGNFDKVHIGEDSWIGNSALVMANIGKKCVIGAGSVVTSEIPDYAIAVGNPARVVRSRLDDNKQDAED